MNWYALNKEYVNYLKAYDAFVPDVEYIGRLKCFLGIVFKSDNGIDYFAPLTSYKPKFNFMQNDIDFFKIVDDNGRIYGAIAINNMIPVPSSEYVVVTKENLKDLRSFRTRRELNQYWKLLQKELSCVDEQFIMINAKKLLEFVALNPHSRVAKRCCNFKLLEKKCNEYILQNTLNC